MNFLCQRHLKKKCPNAYFIAILKLIYTLALVEDMILYGFVINTHPLTPSIILLLNEVLYYFI